MRVGLVDGTGKPLPLTLEGENQAGPDERVLELTQAQQRFVFTGIAGPPLLSLGRRFSAPVIFRTPLDRAGRARLMGRDADAFNRWESGQVLAGDILLDMAGAARAGRRAAHLPGAGRPLRAYRVTTRPRGPVR